MEKSVPKPPAGPILRDNKGRLVKGTAKITTHKGPARVEVLAKHIAERTQGGLTIANELLQISTDKRYRPNERIRAMEVLLDRMLGKAIDVPAMLAVAANGPDKRVHSDLSDAVLEQLIRSLPQPTSADTVDGQVSEPACAQPTSSDEKPE